MSKAAAFLNDPPAADDRPSFETIIKHGHQDLVQAVAFNNHGDRCATGSVDGKIRVFNRHKDGAWRLCDTWGAHASEILEIQWLPTTVYPNLLASLGIEGRFKLWAEDPAAPPGRRFSESTRNGPQLTIPARSLQLYGSNGAVYPPNPPPPPTSGFGSVAPAAPPAPETSTSSGVPMAKPAFETRNARSPYRSFSLKHLDDSRLTYLALLSADGTLTVYENDHIENLASFTQLDEFSTTTPSTTSSFTTAAPGTTTAATSGSAAGGTTEEDTDPSSTTSTAAPSTTTSTAAAATALPLTGPKPAARGEETSFRVRFDPNPEVCYTALRAGVPSDALGLVVAVMDVVRVYRTRDTIRATLGMAAAGKGFYLAAEVPRGVHGGLVRDVAWAPGNIRGYDVVATACQDGWVRVFRLDALLPPAAGAAPAAAAAAAGGVGEMRVGMVGKGRRLDGEDGAVRAALMASSGIRAGLDHQSSSSRAGPERKDGATATAAAAAATLPGQIRHVMTEISRMDSHHTPVWRVAFDDDGQILGSVGDEGKLVCYRQKPDGSWAKSTEMAMVKMKMAAP
ncbi:b4e2af9a-46be-49a3-bdc1-5e758905613e [Thermothielavioides terrestris]|uniref:B4e2af9a-46be-49a3-bdc1-5e758905613e n=1 Tax=Thermothielavioides terrestris TaxID=2587410 RepID=A0A3S4AQZ2_9PEZI|nr:b4e2af9a-46be-49a3-bdc1-5e758905613e [Thermothielavioides terrestris]